MNRRPVGVILSAIVLGMAAFFLLGMALLMLLGTVISSHAPSTTPQPATGFVLAIGIGMAFFYAALAGWAIATLVGLVRLRRWARISIMIIGGCTAALGLFSACISFAMPTLMASMPMPPNSNADPKILHAVFIGMGLFALLIAVVGVWWLVYFAQRPTREAFTPQTPPPDFVPNIYAAPQPLSSSDFLQPAQQSYPPPVQQPVYVVPQTTGTKRPISITILAVIFFLCGTMTIPSFFLSQPLLLFGFAVSTKFAIILKLILALWTVASGIGLLKLQKPAWYLAMSYCGFCILNTTAILLPGGMDRMRAYMHHLVASNPMTAASSTAMPAFDPFSGPFFAYVMIPSILFGVAVIAFAMVLLWRARWAFEPTPNLDQAAV